MPKKMNRPMPKRGTTRIQFQVPERQSGARLTVPAALARQVGPEALFAVELTDEGILFRYLEGPVSAPYPEWLTNGKH
jgi:hypothetical protein